MRTDAVIALYETKGMRTKYHKYVLYIAWNIDWSSRQLERNGHKTKPMAIAPMTQEAWDYRNERKRMSSLQYNGIAPADRNGLAEDLRTLGYDEKTVERLIKDVLE